MSIIKVRPAAPADLEGIVQVERAVWEDGVGAESAASAGTIAHRISLCNAGPPPGWFWVAESGDGIAGCFVLQPTRMPPEECVNWAAATDDGMLTGTFDPEGQFVYGVSLGVMPKAPEGTAELLAHAIHAVRLASRREVLYACARMSGFSRAHARRGIAPEDYWSLRRADGTPRDPFLWHFQALIGLRPTRLLRDGFPPDRESGGHGVLCMSTDPLNDALASARKLVGLQQTFQQERSDR